MAMDIYAILERFAAQYDLLKRRFQRDEIALVMFQALQQELRHSQPEPQTKPSVRSANPATEKQLQYLKRLGVTIPAGLTRPMASTLIDQARARQKLPLSPLSDL